MSDSEKNHLNSWLQKAEEDIAIIKKLSSTEDDLEFYRTGICFHCQQAIEKYLKAFLIFHKTEFRKTHDLEWLLNQCKQIDADSFSEFDFKNLTDYGISSRYPDDFESPSTEELNYYIESAKNVRDLILSLVKIN